MKKKRARLDYATRLERGTPRPRLRLRGEALHGLLLQRILMLWAIVLGVVLMLSVFPGVPALTQNVLDALLSDLDLVEE